MGTALPPRRSVTTLERFAPGLAALRADERSWSRGQEWVESFWVDDVRPNRCSYGRHTDTCAPEGARRGQIL